ncbi:trypsin-like peptidase domain-containing protein [Nocardia sp. NPDC052566]|uniref:trypsin-like peptidase domain-containing protein n=1 Tax=Nocardia sp. NPDC052566 TaxID=3364330 RepID=UPI0037CC9E84
MPQTRIRNDRVVAVFAHFDRGRTQIGSGFVVAPGLVLTAWHCTVDRESNAEPSKVTVARLTDGATVRAIRGAASPSLDLAVLTLPADCDWAAVLAPVRFGRTDITFGEVLTGCAAVGFPLWQRESADRCSGTVRGDIRTSDGVNTGLWQLRDPETRTVALPPEWEAEHPREPPSGNRPSPWAGLSGALLFHGSLAIGVVVLHKPWQGDAIVVRPISELFTGTGGDSVARALGLRGIQQLAMVDAETGRESVARDPVPQWARTPERRAAMLEIREQTLIRCNQEVAVLGLARPRPMPVRWKLAEGDVSDHSGNVFGDTVPHSLDVRSDEVDQLMTQFLALPRRRLVIVGQPGSGKTVLAQLLSQALLLAPDPDEPVPIWLTAGSWDIDTFPEFRDWLVASLGSGFPNLARRYGAQIMRGLVDNRLILPILDGLDEIEETTQAKVLEALDKHLIGHDPLIVTCRVGDYRTLVQRATALTGAAVIEAQPLTSPEVVDYLRSSIAKSARGQWEPILTDIAAHQDGPLAQACATPLGLWLLRTVYHDDREASNDPASLLDRARLPDSTAIKAELLDELIPAVIKARGPSGADPADLLRPRRQWDPAAAKKWLTYLSQELHGVRDLRWWQLRRPYTPKFVHDPRAVSRRLWSAMFIAGALTVGGLVWLGIHHPDGLLLASIIAAYPAALSWRVRRPKEPIGARYRGFGAHMAARLFTRDQLALNSIGGLILGPLFGLAIGIPVGDSRAKAVYGLILGVPGAFGIALLSGLYQWLWPSGECSCAACETRLSSRSRTPASTFKDSRSRTLSMIVYGILLIGLPGGLALDIWGIIATGRPPLYVLSLWRWDLFALAVLAITCLLAAIIGLAVGLFSEPAWIGFRVSTGILAMRGELPRRTMTFLDDAHRLGLLRTAGTVYQFRHAELQDRLAPRESWPDQKLAREHALHEEFEQREQEHERHQRESNQRVLTERLDAVALFRPLAAVDPDRHAKALAEALSRLADQHSEMGAEAAAITVMQEAVDLWRSIAETGTSERYDLVKALQHLAEFSDTAGDHTRAVAAASEAVTVQCAETVNYPLGNVTMLGRSLEKLTDYSTPIKRGPIDIAPWSAAIDAMTTPVAAAVIQAHLAVAAAKHRQFDISDEYLTSAIRAVSSDPNTADLRAVRLLEEARGWVRFCAGIVRSRYTRGRRRRRLFADHPDWVCRRIDSESAHFALTKAFVTAVGWPAIKAVLSSVPDPHADGGDVRTQQDFAEFSADQRVLAILYPTVPRLRALPELLTEIAHAGLGNTIQRYQRLHDAGRLDAAWATTPTWDESTSFLRDARRRRFL